MNIKSLVLSLSLALGIAAPVGSAFAQANQSTNTAQSSVENSTLPMSRPQYRLQNRMHRNHEGHRGAQGRAHRGGSPIQTSGTIARYIAGPGGAIRGFQLNNGMLVMLHGRSGNEMSSRVAVGQLVQVQGFTRTAANPNGQPNGQSPATTGSNIIFRATVTHNGNVVVQTPTPGNRLAQLPVRTASGTVQNIVAGARGGVRLVMLSDGTTIFLTRPLSAALRQRGVRVGETVSVTGRGNPPNTSSPNGTASGLLATQITFSDGSTFTTPQSQSPNTTPTTQP